jgi:quercetin dioxygenase-like cupin family protein
MSNFQLCLIRETGVAEAGVILPACWRTIWLAEGRVQLNGQRLEPGGSHISSGPLAVSGDAASGVDWLRFELFAAGAEPWLLPASQLLSRQDITVSEDEVLLRLDQVSFPPGATAYRHVHPGPGIRYLVKGQLELISNHGCEIARPGQAWFEAANSPVRAVADAALPETSFVRFMVLPVAFAGRPTINILDADDAEKPRRQVTERYVDQKVRLAQDL